MMSSSFGGLIRPHGFKFGLLHRALDAAILLISLELCDWSLNIVGWHSLLGLAGAWSVAFFLIFAEGRGLYGSWRLDSMRHEAMDVLRVWFAVMCALVILAYSTHMSTNFPRRVFMSWMVVAPASIILARLIIRTCLRALRKQGRNTRSLAFAGAGDLAQKLSGMMEKSAWMGLNVVGAYDDRDKARLQIEGFSVQGDLSNLVQDARDGKIDYVYITLPMHAEQRIIQLIDELADTTASVCLVPDFFVFDLFHAKWFSMGGIPMVSVFESPFHGVDGWLKRAEDVLLGSLFLMLSLPLMLVIAIGVKLTPGPVIFKQRRYGLNGEIIDVWKFRSMSVCEDGEYIPQAQKRDPRVTTFGSFLRRTSMDELPQFVNVLQGRMSIVGPRPHAVAHNEQYRGLIQGYMLRHKIKPGITGLAQVNGWRGETDTLEKMQKRVEFDLIYIRNWSLWLDLKIIWLTVWRGFFGENVY